MRNSVKISIIIPLYNTPIDYFKDCLQSIKDQGMNKLIEVIIVDDCSTVNYTEVYNNFTDLNLTILKPDQNSGPGVCRHIGVDKAIGKYITFIDSDDRFSDSTSLQRLYAFALANPDMDMVCGQTIEELKDGTTYTHLKSFIWCFAKLYKLDFLRKNNINFNSTRANEDNSFCTLCSLCTDKVAWLLEPVYLWRYQPTSITRENNHEYQYRGFKSYVENMIWVYDQCVLRGIEKKEKCAYHCIAVWIRIYFHFLNVFQNKGDAAALEILKLGRWFYDSAYSKIEDKVVKKKFAEVYRNMAETSLIQLVTVVSNISYPEYCYRIKNEDYSEFNQNYDYYVK